MTTNDDEDEALRQAFAELRRRDAAVTPDYEAVLARRRTRARSRTRLAIACVSTGALGLAMILLVRTALYEAASPSPVASIQAWTAPTDFLLRTPGIEVLDSVPRILPRRPLLPGVSPGPPSNQRSPSP